MNDQRPLPYAVACRGVGRCVVDTVRLLWRRQVHSPESNVGMRLGFADGTVGRVYRETVVDQEGVRAPCVLAVAFRLRFVRGWLHTLFRGESILNTPLFVGFPGFVSKLWLAADEHGCYRGIYQWDGEDLAHAYARALWRVLALVSVPGSIGYTVIPSARRDALLAEAATLEPAATEADWWRPVATA